MLYETTFKNFYLIKHKYSKIKMTNFQRRKISLYEVKTKISKNEIFKKLFIH